MNNQKRLFGVEKDENGNTLVQIFISYRRSDNVFNHLLDIIDRTMTLLNTEKLKDTGYRVKKITDITSISFGQKWRAKIEKDILDSDILLAFITPKYLESEPCRYEFNTFYSNKVEDEGSKKKPHSSLCVPVFWTAQKDVDAGLESNDKSDDANNDGQGEKETSADRTNICQLEFKDEKSYKDACNTWEIIKGVNGVEAILPKFIDLLKNEAQGSDYEFVKKCIVQWLADKVDDAIKHIIDDTVAEDEPDTINIPVPNYLSSIKLYTDGRGSKGIGYFTNEGFIVKEGTIIAEGTTASARKPTFESRQKYSQYIDENNRLTKDLVFPSPSAASAFVIGRCSSGKADWKDSKGTKLGDLLAKQEKEQGTTATPQR